MGKNSEPERIYLTPEEADTLKSRIAARELSDRDIKLVLGLISFNLWLQQQLSLAKLTIDKLRNFFGFRTEKKTPKKLKDYLKTKTQEGSYP